jgi:hypothetical protein
MTQAVQDAIASVFRCVADSLDLADDAGVVAAVIEEERLITALTGHERVLAIALTRALTARLIDLEPRSQPDDQAGVASETDEGILRH